MARLKTCEVAEQVGVPYHVLDYLMRTRQIPRPPKDASGDYTWGPADVRAVKEVLAKRPRKKPEAVT
jgi:hypothetical protein